MKIEFESFFGFSMDEAVIMGSKREFVFFYGPVLSFFLIFLLFGLKFGLREMLVHIHNMVPYCGY